MTALYQTLCWHQDIPCTVRYISNIAQFGNDRYLGSNCIRLLGVTKPEVFKHFGASCLDKGSLATRGPTMRCRPELHEEPDIVAY